jgi:site-specific recombinase XerD
MSPSPSEIRQLMTYIKTHVVRRRNARGGRSAEEHLVAALRCLYQRAVDDRLITEAENPARKVAKPRRLPTTRRALPDARLAEINETAATTGDDPELDTLILRLHTETACRRGGALALRPRDLDPDQCLVLPREKGETVRWQPVSPTLMDRLVEDGQQRHAPPDGQLLRYADGRPITRRRNDHLWTPIGRHLPWVATQGISTHWIRHTILTWVERNFGYAVARAYAGHTEGGSEASATATYVRASLAEVAAALAALTGSYCPVAALNFTTSSAGTRPRSLTSMPWALAHSRTSPVFSPLAAARRPVRAGRRAAPLARRAALTYCASASRSCLACCSFRSISYSVPSSPKRTVPSAALPSRSSMNKV